MTQRKASGCDQSAATGNRRNDVVRRALDLAATACAALVITAPAAWSAPGDPDPTFGNPWIVDTDTYYGAQALVLQPDGKLVAVAGDDYGEGFQLLRFNSDGTLDLTFGAGGTVITEVGTDSSASALVLQPDGKLVAAGYAGDPYHDFALMRYNADGTLDTSFGTGGIVTTDVANDGWDRAYALVLQPDGKLLAAGTSESDFALVRYNADGTPDVSFGTGGKVTTNMGDDAYALVLQPDGKVVAGGHSGLLSVLVRYEADGTLDADFGTGGKVVITDLYAGAYALVAQPDGKLVAGGGNYPSGLFALARYNVDGTPDPDFGVGGKVVGSGEGEAAGLALQPDGKLVAVGGGNYQSYLVRYNTNGTLDASFGTGGELVVYGMKHLRALVLQPDGKQVAAGAGDLGLGLVRSTSGGAIDTGHPAGIATAQFGIGPNFASQVAQQGNGGIVTAGAAVSGSDQNFLLVRFLANGSLDTSFGTGGAAITSFSSGQDRGLAVLVLSDDRIVAGGTAQNSHDFALARYHTTGGLDGTFDGDGKVITDLGGTGEEIYALLEQSDGKIVAAGFTSTYPNYSIALARYNTDGALDTSFDGDGKVTRDIVIGSGSETAVAIAQQAEDGKLLVAAAAEMGAGTTDFALLRYNPNGSPDTSFGGGDGLVMTAIQSGRNDVYGMALLPDGKIVLSGDSENGVTVNVALARFNADGTLDTSFGTGGVVVGPEGSSSTVARLRDGRLLVGSYYEDDPSNALQLLRFSADGTLDLSFGINGIARVPYDGDSAFVALQRDGRALVAGDDGDSVLVARFLTSYCGPQETEPTCRSAAKSKLMVKQGSKDSRDKVVFNWMRGDETALGDLLDPLSTSPYSLCLYDDAGLRLQAEALPAGLCDGAACWSALSTGFKYLDKSDQQDGFHKLLLKAAAAGKAKVVVVGRGEALPDISPALPFTGNVSAQVVNEETGTCFAAEFDGGSTLQNDAMGFKGKH